MATHSDQPVFHLLDRRGWVNDPNGPLLYKNQYHMFFQHLTDTTQWTWGLSWGHATSTDLLHWRQLPPALSPDPDWHDADGCFSGCATVDTHGRPAILYTGVKKKPDAGEREGMPLTVNKLCYERQLIARPADPDDPDLTRWVKVPQPFLWSDMTGLPTNCFRDPFVLEKPSPANGHTWRVMVGSNIQVSAEDVAAAAAASMESDSDDGASSRSSSSCSSGGSGSGAGSGSDAGSSDERLQVAAGNGSETLGTATVYRSTTEELEGGWEYEGLLCVARPGDGAIWECPIMVPLALPAGSDDAHQAAAGAAATTPQAARPSLEQQQAPAPAQASASASSSSSGSGGAWKPLLRGGQGAVAAIAAAQQQQQQQQGQAADRAMSGCLGLWTPAAAAGTDTRSPGGSANNSPTSQPLPIAGSSNNSAAKAASGSGITGSFRDWTLGNTPPQSPHSPQQQLQQQAERPLPPTHLFSVSAGVCPAIYWLGRYAGGRFDLDAADGPLALDLGDVMYAPNLLEDAQGRQLIWSWLQEHPSALSHDYAGCISLPRQLQLGVRTRRVRSQHLSLTQQSPPAAAAAAGSSQPQPAAAAADEGEGESEECEFYLIQTPLPELALLRSGRGLRLRGIRLPANKAWSVPSQVSASHLDLSLTISPTPGVQRFQLLLGPLRQEGQQQQQPNPTVAAAAAVEPAEAAAAAAAAGGGGGQPGSPSQALPQFFVPMSAGAAASAPGTAGDAASSVAAPADAGASNLVSSSSSSSRYGQLLGPSALSVAGSGSPTGLAAAFHSPTGSPGSADMPAVLPLLPGMLHSPMQAAAAAGAAAAASALSGMAAGGAAAGAAALGPLLSPAELAAVTDAAAAAAAGASSHSGLQLADDASALAAAAAAELSGPEHHQAAAITYEFGSSQLQVLVGPPAEVLKLLKQQQEELAAATSGQAAAAAGSAAGSPNHDHHHQHQHQQQQSSRTGTPTEEALGFAPPLLPPAPCGMLSASMAAAQVAGVRVLSCQLRQLEPGEPLQLRLLLDYSIVELFMGTGEALTTRVYRGVPTARAAESAARRAGLQASNGLAADEEHLSMSGSLANLSMLLHQHTTAAASPRSSVAGGVGAGVVGSSRQLGASGRISSFGSLSPTSPAAGGFSRAAEGLVGSLGSPAASRPGRRSIDSLLAQGGIRATPFSPATGSSSSSSSLVHYFSPGGRSWEAAGSRHAAHHLPTLAGISEAPPGTDQQAAAGAPSASTTTHSAVAAAAALLAAHPSSTSSSSRAVAAASADATTPGGSSAAPAVADCASSIGGSSFFALQQDLAAADFPDLPDPSSPPAARRSIGGSAGSSGLFSTRSAPVSPFAAASREFGLRAEAFPGFSPHKPLPSGISSSSSAGGAGVGGLAASQSAGAKAAGARLASWFQKVSGSRASKAKGPAAVSSGESSSGSSRSVATVVPPTFGVPVLPPHFLRQQVGQQLPERQPAAASASMGASRAADVSDLASGVSDVQPVHDQPVSRPHQQQQQPGLGAEAAAAGTGGSPVPGKAAGGAQAGDDDVDGSTEGVFAAFVKPKLSIRTSSTTSSTASDKAAPAARQQPASTAQLDSSGLLPAPPPPASAPPAAAAGAGAPGSSAAQPPLHGLGPRFPSLRGGGGSQSSSGVNSPSSARSSGGQAGSLLRQSPRSRNWRTSFVFSEEEEEEGSGGGGAGLQGEGSAAATAADLIMADFQKLLLLPPKGPAGVAGWPTLTPPSPAEAAFGPIYARACSPVSSSTVDSRLQATAAPAGDGAGQAPASSKSGYVPGAMRELCLVALGGGGVVVQRLEAHEMNSMWEDEGEACG